LFARFRERHGPFLLGEANPGLLGQVIEVEDPER